uniref:Uncharacterized protein n=1 Tax=Arundo donax TaxID=35708 RepID=A0A0A9EY04_ARUDO
MRRYHLESFSSLVPGNELIHKTIIKLEQNCLFPRIHFPPYCPNKHHTIPKHRSMK